MKSVVIFAVLFVFSTFNIRFAAAEDSSDSKIKALQESVAIGQDTLSAPLLLSQPQNLLSPVRGSLLNQSSSAGFEGDLAYQKLAGDSYRLRYRDLKQAAAFFFLFEKPLDLKDRWVRVHYSGLHIPSHVKLELDHDEMRDDSEFDLYLNQQPQEGSVDFKLPDKEPFGDIHSLRLVMDPELLEDPYGDFLILGLELLPAGEGPLDQVAASDPSRFDAPWSPFDADNLTAVNPDFAF